MVGLIGVRARTLTVGAVMLLVAASSLTGPLAAAAATEPVLGGTAPLQDDPKETPQPPPAQINPGAPTPSQIPTWQEAQTPGEIASLRTRDSKTVKTAAGPLQTTVYAGSINYKDGSGSWQPIDDTLIAAPGTATGYGFTNRANQYSVLLPSDLSSAPVKVSQGAASVSFQLAGASGAPTAVAGDTETYGSALHGVDLIYQATPDALKESIRLDNPTAPSSYAFTVSTAGVSATPNRSGAIDLVDSAGKVSFSFARPSMVDAAGVESDSVHMTLAGNTLTVAADAAWLADPARKFPVVIDPTVSSYGADQNCYITAAATNTSNCGPGVTTLKAGWDGSFARRTLLQFNIQNNIFPEYSNVLSAELGLYLTSETTTTSTSLAAYPITQSTGWTTSATWNNYDGTHAWSGGAGGTYDTSSAWSSTATAGGTTGTTIKWYPNKLAQAWLDGTINNATTDNTPGEGTTNVGLIVRSANESVNNLFTFASSGDGTQSHRPYLQITFEPRFGELGYYKQIPQTLNDRTKLLVNPGTGDLILKNDDLHITNAGIAFDVTRYFNNPNYNVFYMGNGWSLTTSRDVQLRLYPQSVAYYHDGTATEVYQGTTGTSFTEPPAGDADLTYTGSGSTDSTYCLTAQQYTITEHKSLEKKTFYVPTSNTAIALLCKDVDSNGNGLKFSYNSDLTPNTIASTSSSQTLTFTNTSGNITKIQDSTGRNVQYSYTSGNLTGYTDAGGHSYTYHYDGSNNLTEVDDPNSPSNATQFTYDAGYRVTKITKADGTQTPPNWQYSYSFDSGKASGTTTETDPLSNVTTYTVDTKSRITNVKDAKNHNQPTTWSADSAVAQYTDYSNNNTVFGFNSAGGEDVDTITSGSGSTSNFCFPSDTKYSCGTPANNPTHMPSSSKDAQGNQTTYSYDGVNTGNLVTATFADGTAAHQYFTNQSGVPGGLLGGYLDPKSTSNCTVPNYSPSTTATVCFTYDSSGNVTQASYPSPLGAVSYTYDSLNRQHSMTDGKSQITGYCYDSVDRVTQISHVTATTFTCPMSSPDITKNYDNNGNLTSLVDGNGTTSYQYDHRNLMTQKTFPDTTTVNWTYDAAENLKTQVDGAGTTTYGYDADNFLSSVTEPTTGRVINFSVDNNGNRTEIDYPTGTSTQHLTVVTMQYDGSNRMTRLKSVYNASTTQLDLSYCYQSSSTACSSPTQATDTGLLNQKTDNLSGNVTTYLYDHLDRLCDAQTKTSGGSQVSDYYYTFDNNSNRATQIVNGTWLGSPSCNAVTPPTGTSTSYGYNGANELTTVGSNSYVFDGNGSETTGFLPSGTSLSLSYDNKNRNTSMTPSGGTAESEVYRGYPQNELLTWGGNTYKDGVLGTYRSATSSTSTYYVRDNRGHILESTSSGTRYFYLTDYEGSVLQTVDINGALANTYSYDPYGNATKTGSVADNWTYIGEWQDSGTNLYHLGARYYDPLVGRFTQQDAVQQVNRYTYSSGNPISMEDPSGMLFGAFGDWVANEVSTGASWVQAHPWQFGIGAAFFLIAGGFAGVAVATATGVGALSLPLEAGVESYGAAAGLGVAAGGSFAAGVATWSY